MNRHSSFRIGSRVLGGALTLALWLGVVAGAAGNQAPSSIRDRWEAARQAYDASDWPEAARAYQSILDEGYFSSEVYFNLGNALYKGGQPGEAVLNYRRALSLAPRDPDARANLQFVLQHAGLTPPGRHWLDAIIGRASRSEWQALQLAVYWSAAVLAGLWIVKPGWRFALNRLLALLAVLLGFSLVAVYRWRSLERFPEVVVTEPGQQALYAPLEGATISFGAPEGSILRVMEIDAPWLKVATGKQEGWIKQTACEPVLPLFPPRRR
jgi:tetratricopeptide (TPR) repeat protein